MNKFTPTPIKKIGRVITGKTPSTAVAENFDGDFMFVTPTELHTNYLVERSKKTLTRIGLNSIRTNTIRGLSIAVGCIGWDMGNVALINEECATNQQINSVTDINLEEYNPYYLYYWLSTKKAYLFQISTVTRTPILNKTTFEDILVPLPSKTVQDQVASVLLPISRKIAHNSAVNAELEKAAKLLYDYWFVQFDFPNENGDPYHASSGVMEYNTQLKREIPKGWKVGKVPDNDLCGLIGSGVDEFDGEKVYLSTSEVDGMEITDHSITVDYDSRPARANMQPTLNSVWFAKMKDTLKHLLISDGAEDLVNDYLLSTGFAGLQCTADSIYYVWNYLNAGYFESKKNQIATGATQQAINDTDLEDFDIVIPNSDILKRYNAIVTPYYKLITRNKFQSKELSKLRDFLLPLLMNGQVTVKPEEAHR